MRRPGTPTKLYANLASVGGMIATTYAVAVVAFIGYHALAGSRVSLC